MKISVTYTEPALPGWTHLHPNDIDTLPDWGVPIQRIYVGWVLERLDDELVAVIMHTWHDHPQVSVETLLAITGERAASRRLYPSVRESGWGIVCPYNPELLALDRWPVVVPPAEQYGALCRPIK